MKPEIGTAHRLAHRLARWRQRGDPAKDFKPLLTSNGPARNRFGIFISGGPGLTPRCVRVALVAVAALRLSGGAFTRTLVTSCGGAFVFSRRTPKRPSGAIRVDTAIPSNRRVVRPLRIIGRRAVLLPFVLLTACGIIASGPLWVGRASWGVGDWAGREGPGISTVGRLTSIRGKDVPSRVDCAARATFRGNGTMSEAWRSVRVGQTPSPGTPCGPTGGGCAITSVLRIPPSSHPCQAAACGTANTCVGTPPECGRCFLADCVAIGSAWTATSPSPTTICSSGGGVGNCEDLINSRGAKVVLREEYFCVATLGGTCLCNVNGAPRSFRVHARFRRGLSSSIRAHRALRSPPTPSSNTARAKRP